MHTLLPSLVLACVATSPAGAPRSAPTLARAVPCDTTAVVAVVAPAPPDAARLLALPALDSAPPRAVEHGDAYYRRLTIHRYASYTMLPLFAAQYVLGDRILDEKVDAFAGRGNGVNPSTRTAHQYVAGGVAALFAVNTVTGLWNWYDSRGETPGRGLRTTHTLLMLAADAGFAATGLIAGRARDHGPDEARTHRNVALGSMALSTAGAAIMWFRRD